MAIPQFTSQGKLPKGIHICSGEEFISSFCNSELRKHFIKPISDILDYAKERYASEIFIGGSFVTANERPRDLDCVIVFENDKDMPNNRDKVDIKGLKIDVLFASKENPKVVDITLKLFSSCRYGGDDVGLVQIDLYKKNQNWEIKHYPSDEEFEIVKRMYNDRSLIDLKEKRGVLVTIHGLYSAAEWNRELAPIASSQDWIFAPYTYDNNNVKLLVSQKRRQEVLEDFRDWIYELSRKFEEPISVIAHSYGTALIGSYMDGFYSPNSPPPVSFNSIILTGSILNQNFDWERLRGWSVGSVFNTVAKNDEWVRYMPQSDLRTLVGMSTLFGDSGVEGFKSTSPMISADGYEIFNHNNTIKPDIIEKKWMPYLNANRSSLYIESMERFRRDLKK